MGIERVEVLAFTPQLKSLTAREFMEQVLRDQMNVRVLLTGYDNRFGRNREEGFDDYVRYGQELGIEVCCLPPLPATSSSLNAKNVSSSYIRQLLSDGQVAEAADCLGHPYSISGHVAHGEHIGTELGFPTANLVPSESQLIPSPGAYAVKVTLLTPHAKRHDEHRHASYLRRTRTDTRGAHPAFPRRPLRTSVERGICQEIARRTPFR